MGATLKPHRIETTLTDNGTLTLDGLRFGAGEEVEIIVLPRFGAFTSISDPENCYPLRGLLAPYARPTDPVALRDWNVLQ